ncbi:MAG: 50S ribosomal protein L15 [Candidatus Yanofskybacteria bacterium RIFCSPLOWO2_02_FULL_43_10b]|uniref:Large ribosomal subunit protein uL15 n=1 Tax=Candidatus Yanofskybacteria bacterium RIFCSPLOWO2_02_FULL_43_10b TaxID=1802704 RepID=A0A1F8GZG3_9BACT|nr:MAG: 50S ribosomal protein L15 [Candidatus Yanofskybacteria bacterium RIFCSPLOWO2_02_FULL_43_10b]
MQVHEIKKPKHLKKAKRIGRGGKRGTFSGKGSKGQKARSGVHMGADFRGGNPPLWKVFPKKRGSTKKVGIKHRSFRLRHPKATPLNLKLIDKIFSANETVSPATLLEKKLIKAGEKVKVLGLGDLKKKLNFDGLAFSESAKEKILKADGQIK